MYREEEKKHFHNQNTWLLVVRVAEIWTHGNAVPIKFYPPPRPPVTVLILLCSFCNSACGIQINISNMFFLFTFNPFFMYTNDIFFIKFMCITELALRLVQSISCNVCVYVCLSVCCSVLSFWRIMKLNDNHSTLSTYYANI